MSKNTLRVDKGNNAIKQFDSDKKEIERNISFSFRDFLSKHIIDDKQFNNAYKDEENAKESIRNMFKVFKHCGQYKMSQLGSQNCQIHYHEIKDNEYEMVKSILIKKFNLPENRVLSFERLFQIGLSGGERYICYSSGNVISILFIDNNHLIYKDSSRDVKEKMKYKVKSILAD